MRLSTRALLVLAVVFAGCGEEDGGRERREWLASDHQQPAEPDPATTPTPTPDQMAEPDEATIARAAEALFGARCASCHGVEGRGDGDAAPVSEMPNFTTAEYQDANTDADVARAIRMGSGLMPAFGQQLNERGIAALVGHVRRLRGEE